VWHSLCCCAPAGQLRGCVTWHCTHEGSEGSWHTHRSRVAALHSWRVLQRAPHVQRRSHREAEVEEINEAVPECRVWSRVQVLAILSYCCCSTCQCSNGEVTSLRWL
jgi:hypothetical protein